jgi:hypothetical protein
MNLQFRLPENDEEDELGELPEPPRPPGRSSWLRARRC